MLHVLGEGVGTVGALLFVLLGWFWLRRPSPVRRGHRVGIEVDGRIVSEVEFATRDQADNFAELMSDRLQAGAGVQGEAAVRARAPNG